MTFLLHIARYLTTALYGTAIWSARNRKKNGSKVALDSTVGSADRAETDTVGNGITLPRTPCGSSDQPYEVEDDYWKEAMSRIGKAVRGKQ
jgi:hypothetical protein